MIGDYKPVALVLLYVFISVNGEVTKELLPKSYKFRMNYGGASLDQTQDVGVNPIVTFQTGTGYL